MIKKFLIFILCLCSSRVILAADLVSVFQQALISDPTFQEAIAQRFSTRTGVPISVSALLPNISAQLSPNLTRSSFSGAFYRTDPETGAALSPRSNTKRAYVFSLNLNQTVFNFAQFAAVASQVATAKSADATLNAALQNLMIRVANAYFAILKDEEDLRYGEATKRAFAQQLQQIKQQYAVGLKTLTDVYTAQASYDSAAARYIAGETQRNNDRENLRVLTGKYYTNLAKLGENFPLTTPYPAQIDRWVDIATAQNWSIKASRHLVDAARHNIKQQFAGHLPTVNIEASLSRTYALNINRYMSITSPEGPGTQVDRTIGLNVNIPIFSGGLVNAQTDQAVYNYQIAYQQFEKTFRDTINLTRQSYLGTVSGITQVQADRQTIKSTTSALRGMEASYQAGTETLVNVINQQEKVFEAQSIYAKDRYNFVINVLTLKQAAGTLGLDDLCAVNRWLVGE